MMNVLQPGREGEATDRPFLYFAVFASGMTTLAIELSASHLLGSVFGTSNLVWASIIGLILIYLTIGYFLGGRWADRSPKAETMYSVMAWGAFTAGLVPVFAHPVLMNAAQAFDQLQVGVLFGSFTAVLVLFILPVTLLGTISPFAIRLAIDETRNAGVISGRIYAISTLGSFVGTFLPSLLFIPLVGTRRTFLIFSAFLVLTALAGLWRSFRGRRALLYSWMPLILALLYFFWAGQPIKSTPGQIFETESAYNYIQVLEADGYHMLRLNEGQGIHSEWHPEILDYEGPWEQFLAAPFFNSPKVAPKSVQSIAILGLAAGTTARQASAVFGPIPIDGYEIDPEIIAVGRKYFGMDLPNLNAMAEDGRVGLRRSHRLYTLIAVDAYRPPYIPWHMTTQEFFQEVRDHLVNDGVMAINVGRAPADRRLIDDLVATISTVFPSVYVMDLPNTFNSIVYATKQPTRIENLYANWLYLDTLPGVHPLLLHVVEVAIANQRVVESCEGSQIKLGCGRVYTDDLAPVEWVTNRMILNFVFTGDMDELR
jgi:predicted membrane-bound spermidine synthase